MLANGEVVVVKIIACKYVPVERLEFYLSLFLLVILGIVRAKATVFVDDYDISVYIYIYIYIYTHIPYGER